jgi:hypothetical protein
MSHYLGELPIAAERQSFNLLSVSGTFQRGKEWFDPPHL